MSKITEKTEGKKKYVIFKTSALVYVPLAIVIIAMMLMGILKVFRVFFIK
jgi:hypothetical protein